MSELLRLLAEYYAFLFVEQHYRIVDSATRGDSGDSFVLLASDRLQIGVTRGRGQFLFDFCSPGEKLTPGRKRTQDLDALARLLTGDSISAADPPERAAFFLREYLSEIERLLAPESVGATTSALADIKRKRATEQFG